MKPVSKSISPFHAYLHQGLRKDPSSLSELFTQNPAAEEVAEGTWNAVALSIYMGIITPIRQDLIELEREA